MSLAKIEKLTPEQEALIPVCREKWRRLALSVEPIDRSLAADAVISAYALLGLPEPEIVFCDRPTIAWKTILRILIGEYLWNRVEWLLENEYIEIDDNVIENLGNKIANQLNRRNIRQKLGTPLESKLEEELISKLRKQLNAELVSCKGSRVRDKIAGYLGRPLLSNYWGGCPESTAWGVARWQILNQGFDFECDCRIENTMNHAIVPGLWAKYKGVLFDFYISALGCSLYDRHRWSVFQALVQNCGYIFPYQKICFICDRPRILSLDSQYRLHAEGSPALQFADGYSYYAYHGIRLPEEYGKIHPKDWQAEWLLAEKNAEVRRAIVRGIGYARLCQELQAVEIDSWREYALLEIKSGRDFEQIYLLKMTCPSSGDIHVLRVTPNMRQAREAIKWINWGIDPEEFLVET